MSLDDESHLRSLDFVDAEYIFNAYLFSDDGEVQVPAALTGQAFQFDLPFALTGIHTFYGIVISIPEAIPPGRRGWSLRFELTRPAASLTEPEAGRLTAVRSGMFPTAKAPENEVSISVASTLAYELTPTSINSQNHQEIGSILSEVLEKMNTMQSRSEKRLANLGRATAGDYIDALAADTKFLILMDTGLQTKLAEAWVSGERDVRSTASSSYADRMQAFAIQARATLRETDGLAALFPGGVHEINSLPHPETFPELVYAPSSITFLDADPSIGIGGSVVLGPARLSAGITGYALYLGGSSLTEAKIKKIGGTTTDDLLFAVEVGSSVPAGASRLWAFPINDAGEVNSPASTELANSLQEQPSSED